MGALSSSLNRGKATLDMFHYRLPPLLYPFLNNKELAALSSMNRELEQETRLLRKTQKAMVASRVLHDFYLRHFGLISVHRMSDSRAQIRRFFAFLPELGIFLTQEKIRGLDFSPPLSEYFSAEECKEILATLYPIVKENRTLTYCNLRGFEQYIAWKDVVALLSTHPMLSMEHPIATHFCFYQRRV